MTARLWTFGLGCFATIMAVMWWTYSDPVKESVRFAGRMLVYVGYFLMGSV